VRDALEKLTGIGLSLTSKLDAEEIIYDVIAEARDDYPGRDWRKHSDEKV